MYNCMKLIKRKWTETDGKNCLLDQEVIQESDKFPITIKGSLDRVQEGIIALSFHTHHVPNNYYFSTILQNWLVSVAFVFRIIVLQISFQLHREDIFYSS